MVMNSLDQDMGMPGTMIVGSDGGTGGAGHTYLVTCDKSGQCYVLPSSPSSLPGYAYPDCTGCEFAGSQTALSYPGYSQCYGNTSPPTGYVACDSISSMVYYYGYLFLWPYGEDVDWCYWNSGTFSCNPHHAADPTDDLSPSGFPGGSLTLSLNQTSSPSTTVLENTGVLWATINPTSAKPYEEPDTATGDFTGVVRAYGLTAAPPQSGNPNFTVDTLWTSPPYLGSIFALPTVANGYLYVPAYGSAKYGSAVLVYYP